MARSAGSAYQKWHYVPDLLSASRGLLAIPIYIMAVDDKWVLGFWLLVVALMTDFFDGLAAKKLHAETVLGGNIDRISDFGLALAGLLGLFVSVRAVSVWMLYAAIPVGLFVGYVRFFLPPEGKIPHITTVFSVTLLFAIWAYIAWGYLVQAYGWSWWYPPITVVCLAVLALKKKHRIRAWFGWIVAAPKRT